MNNETGTPSAAAGRAAASARAKALLVHLYTASTMAVLMVATAFLLNDQLTAALFTMLLSIVIDATDGSLARRFQVKRHVPEFDGRTMDDIIDYVSYVFLPAVFLLKAGMLLQPAVIVCCLPLIASAFGFSRVDAKLDNEGFFVGFPSYWNIVVAYFYLTGSPPWLNTLIIIFLSAMVFVPTRYIYITRFRQLPQAHLAGATLSGVTMLTALFVSGDLRQALVAISLIYPVIYTAYSLFLDRRARKSAQ
jgi:phosphatidylcholine synthase